MAKIIKGKEFEKRQGATSLSSSQPIVDFGEREGAVLGKRVLSAREEAEKIVSKAHAAALRIRQEAEELLASAKAVQEEARRQGFTKGEAEGLATVTEKLIELEMLKEKFCAEAEAEVIELVQAIAEKVIGELVMQHPEVVRHVVRMALERSIGDRIAVRVHPEDYAALMAGDHEFRDIIDRTKRLLFKEDDAIPKGGCVVETEVGTIDAQLETQLAAIRKALKG